MRKKELIAKAKLQEKLKEYQKQRAKCRDDLAKIRGLLTKERNREQYLRRCIVAIEAELGHVKAGQMTFNI